MRGHIKQRAKGSWSIVIDVGRDPRSGKRQQQWHTVRGTKKEAEAKLRELLHALEKGAYVRPQRITLGEWLEEWLEGYAKMHVTPRTQESYRGVTYRHIIPALGAIPLAELRPNHLQSHYSRALVSGRMDGTGGLSARSVRYQHRILSQALKHAVAMGLVVRNVAEAVTPPRPQRAKISVLAPVDITKLLEAARETSFYVFFYTLLYTGLRRGELLALRWGNLDLDMASLHVVESAHVLNSGEYVIKEPKTPNSRRTVALPPSLVLLLRQHRADQEKICSQLGRVLTDRDFAFAHLDGSPIKPNAVTLAFIRLIRRSGLPHIRLHDLRHTHATLMLKAGVHPKVVSERLGHAGIGITLDTYSHVLPGLQEAAAERFDEMLGSRSAGEEEEKSVSKPLAKDEGLNGRPYRIRTCDTLIKSQVLCQLS